MKKVAIIHCWGGTPYHCWYQNEKKKMETAGMEVFIPELPNTDHPKYNEWIEKIKETLEIDENTYLIGHSLGTTSILRLLTEIDQQVAGIILVAPVFENLGYEELSTFFSSNLDFKRIRESAKNILIIQSDNDSFIPIDHAEALRDHLNCEYVLMHNMQHFSGLMSDPSACTELNIVSSTIINWSK